MPFIRVRCGAPDRWQSHWDSCGTCRHKGPSGPARSIAIWKASFWIKYSAILRRSGPVTTLRRTSHRMARRRNIRAVSGSSSGWSRGDRDRTRRSARGRGDTCRRDLASDGLDPWSRRLAVVAARRTTSALREQAAPDARQRGHDTSQIARTTPAPLAKVAAGGDRKLERGLGGLRQLRFVIPVERPARHRRHFMKARKLATDEAGDCGVGQGHATDARTSSRYR